MPRIYMLLMLLFGYAKPQTSAGKNEGSVEALSKVTFDDDDVVLEKEEESSTSYLELGLCVPQDGLEDIDFSPNFDDDWIRLDHLFEEDSANDPRQDSAKDSRQGSCDGHDNGQIEQVRPNFKAMLVHPVDSYDNYHYEGPNLSMYVDQDRNFPLDMKKPRTKKLTTKLIEGKGDIVNYSGMKRGRKRSSEGKKRIKHCSHCEAEDTPQWRLGPLGPNTLCNACGLRYKVGRLLKNYRPANSPSFDITKHSNYDKRIVRQNNYICGAD